MPGLPTEPTPTNRDSPLGPARPILLRVDRLEEVTQQHKQGVGDVIELGVSGVGELVLGVLEPGGPGGPTYLAAVDVRGHG